MESLDLNAGALAPVADEVVLTDLRVRGEIPPELSGSLVRIGPNPLSGRFEAGGTLNWWPEAGMLHAVAFADGQVHSYRNRWVRTANWAIHNGAEDAGEYLESNPNVNVIEHAGEILALAEGGVPAAITRELETLGAAGAHPGFARGVTAHPKVDPDTGELFCFRADWSAPWLRYGVVDRNGHELLDMEIELPAPSMMHDMAITQTHSILMDLNVGYDFAMLERGHRIPICWQEDRSSRLCVLPRHGGEPRWFEIEPCFIQHVVNAYDTVDGKVVFDALRYPWYFKLDAAQQTLLPDPLAVLWRYTLDLRTGQAHEAQLADLNLELPRINERYTGRKNRYFYSVEQPSTRQMRGIVRFDLKTNSHQRYALAAGDQNSEPIFVPRRNPEGEDDGWVLVSVYRAATHSNEIHILDARNIAAEPLSVVSLGRRIPAGFHGAWIAG